MIISRKCVTFFIWQTIQKGQLVFETLGIAPNIPCSCTHINMSRTSPFALLRARIYKGFKHDDF